MLPSLDRHPPKRHAPSWSLRHHPLLTHALCLFLSPSLSPPLWPACYPARSSPHSDSVTHTRGPLDGSPYAQVQRAPRQTPPAPSPEPPPPPLLSVSSDSGHSSTLTTEPAAESPGRPPPTAAERQELERLLGGCGVASGGRGAGRETAILDDEDQPAAGGGPHLGIYSGHRPGLSRHCSCRQGYREPCGVPNGGYYRPEGTLERRRLAFGAYEGAPQGYAEPSVEKRRLCRSLSEGPYPYPPELGKPANGDFGYRPPGYREVVILEDPGLPTLCSCPTCEEKLALPTAALYGLRLEREAGEGWASEAGKPLLHPVRPGHPLPLLVPACGHHHTPLPDYSCLKPPKAGEEGHEGCSYALCPEGRYGHPGYPALVTYGYGGAVPSCCPAYGRVPHSCGSPGEGRGYPSPRAHSPRAGSISPGSPPYPQSRKLSYEIPAEEGGDRYPLPGHLAPAGPLASPGEALGRGMPRAEEGSGEWWGKHRLRKSYSPFSPCRVAGACVLEGGSQRAQHPAPVPARCPVQHRFRAVWSFHTAAHQQPRPGQGEVLRGAGQLRGLLIWVDTEACVGRHLTQGSATQLNSCPPSLPAAPDGRTPGPPPWRPLRD